MLSTYKYEMLAYVLIIFCGYPGIVLNLFLNVEQNELRILTKLFLQKKYNRSVYLTLLF